MSQAFAILRREHLKPDAEPTTGDLRDALNDIRGWLHLDGETTVAVFRQVCAAINYLVDRQEDLPPPARPYDDAIFCTAAARCPVVQVIDDGDEPGEDTFDPVEFEPAREEATDP